MTESDHAIQENRALRQRIETLGAAVLRVNASLDLNAILREVVEAARGLTDAQLGMVATTDETGVILGDTYFSGFSPEKRREL